MAVVTLDDLPASGPLFGIDPGTKTLGIAVSDGLRMIATPVEIIRRGKKLAPSLARFFELYDERGGAGVAIGLPLNMDGSEGPRAQSTRALAHHLLAVRDIPVVFQDERLSSAEAERAMLEADLSRKRRAELIDASAAAIILNATLARLANIKPES
jgi:putative Holliday junction resolvase